MRRKHRGRDFDDQPSTSTADESTTGLHTDTSEIMDTSGDDSPGGQVSSHSPEFNQLEKAAALFLLCLKEQYQITQTAIDFAVTQVQQMLSFAAEDLQSNLEMYFQSHLPEVSDFDNAMECFRIPDPFMHPIEYMQTKYYREHFDLIVSCYIFILINNV